jgi:hypothetical protein
MFHSLAVHLIEEDAGASLLSEVLNLEERGKWVRVNQRIRFPLNVSGFLLSACWL